MIDGAINDYPLIDGAINDYPLIDGAINDYPLIDGAINDYPLIDGAINDYPLIDGAINDYGHSSAERSTTFAQSGDLSISKSFENFGGFVISSMLSGTYGDRIDLDPLR